VGDPRCVLLVTNHPDTADLYAFALNRAGFTVTSAATPGEALKTCHDAPPDAVIVHFAPAENPAKIGESLRQSNPHMILIGLFSMQLPMTALQHVLQTFDDVILIPCPPDALVTRLQRLFKKQ
jgi:DNA-binding response OmpR family regulator